MNLSDSTSLFTETIKSMEKLLVVKGGEYAGSEDRLANFKRGGQLVGITPLQCAFVYASKHYDAIATYVRDDASGEERPRSESIEGRLDDLMNYCFLMKCIIREKEKGKQPRTLEDAGWVMKPVSPEEFERHLNNPQAWRGA